MYKNNCYSKEVSQLINSASPQVIKWGWVGIFIIFFIIFVGGWFIKFPQTVPYQILLKPTSYSSENIVGSIIIDVKDTIEFTIGQQVKIKIKYLEKFKQQLQVKVIAITKSQKEEKYDVVIDFSNKLKDMIINKGGTTMDCEIICKKDPLIIQIFPALIWVQNIFKLQKS